MLWENPSATVMTSTNSVCLKRSVHGKRGNGICEQGRCDDKLTVKGGPGSGRKTCGWVCAVAIWRTNPNAPMNVTCPIFYIYTLEPFLRLRVASGVVSDTAARCVVVVKKMKQQMLI